MKTTYPALLHDENGTVGISFPDFPGCITIGKDYAEAMNKGQEALEFHLEGMAMDNEDIPLQADPKALKEWLEEDDENAKVAILAVTIPSVKARKVTYTLPGVIADRLERFAKATKRKKSQIVADAIIHELAHN